MSPCLLSVEVAADPALELDRPQAVLAVPSTRPLASVRFLSRCSLVAQAHEPSVKSFWMQWEMPKSSNATERNLCIDTYTHLETTALRQVGILASFETMQ